MRIYTDGSRIKLPNVSTEDYYKGIGVALGWSGVMEDGRVIVKGAQLGGSNINSEGFGIRDALGKICEKPELLNGDKHIQVVTDSKVFIQIIQICLKLTEKEYMEGLEFSQLKMNEKIALHIKKNIRDLNSLGIEVEFKHVRGHGKDPNMLQCDIDGNHNADIAATEASNALYRQYKDGVRDMQKDIEYYKSIMYEHGYVR